MTGEPQRVVLSCSSTCLTLTSPLRYHTPPHSENQDRADPLWVQETTKSYVSTMALFNRKGRPPPTNPATNHAAVTEKSNGAAAPANNGSPSNEGLLPQYNHNGHLVSKHIQPAGESGRRGVDPIHFLKIVWKSSCTISSWVNVLWPFVPAAIALHFVKGDHHLWTFAINYIAMIPSANLLGFAGQELARKLPMVAGILIETTLGSVVEIVLFMVLIAKDDGTGIGAGSKIGVIQAAILGSILTNLLLCLGCCFLVGGIVHKEQTFHAVVSEVGSGLILVAGFALLIPSAFFSSLSGSTVPDGEEGYTETRLRADTLNISHGVSIILIFAFLLYLAYNALSHDNIFKEVLEADEEADRDRHRDLKKAKLTFTECMMAILVALTFVSLIAVFLVEEISFVVEHGIPDNFLGLILLPLVEKAAEHLTAIDEAYDNQIVGSPTYSVLHR